MFLWYWTKFKHILEEKEAQVRLDSWLLALVRRSKENGTIWYYMVLRGFFIAYNDFPSVELKDSILDQEEQAVEVPKEDIQSFLDGKKKELEAYEADRKTIKPLFTEVQERRMIADYFVTFIEGLYGRGDGQAG